MEESRASRGLFTRPEVRLVAAAFAFLVMCWPVWADLGWSTGEVALVLFVVWAAAIALLALDTYGARRAEAEAEEPPQ